MKARAVALFANVYAHRLWPDDWRNMDAYCVEWLPLDVTSVGSHKYIPADRLSADIGAEKGAGVSTFWRFADGSYLLRTCFHGLAVWDGTPEGKAECVGLPEAGLAKGA